MRMSVFEDREKVMGLRVFNFRHILVFLSGCGPSVYVREIQITLESLPDDK